MIRDVFVLHITLSNTPRTCQGNKKVGYQNTKRKKWRAIYKGYMTKKRETNHFMAKYRQRPQKHQQLNSTATLSPRKKHSMWCRRQEQSGIRYLFNKKCPKVLKVLYTLLVIACRKRIVSEAWTKTDCCFLLKEATAKAITQFQISSL